MIRVNGKEYPDQRELIAARQREVDQRLNLYPVGHPMRQTPVHIPDTAESAAAWFWHEASAEQQARALVGADPDHVAKILSQMSSERRREVQALIDEILGQLPRPEGRGL